MLRLRTLRRLLSRARQDWQEVAEGLFAAPAKPPRSRPLRVMRLERRRVLSADFSLTASALVLDGFDQDSDSLAITQQGDSYLFTTEEGWNSSSEGALPTGVSVQGETLSVQRSLFDGLSDGLTVVGDGESALSVTLGEADFSAANGPLSIVSPTSLGQQPFSLFTAPSDGIRLGVAPSGLTVSSLNIAGDLEVTSFGAITDAPGTQILVTGDATFISNAASPDGDFDGDGDVDLADRNHWTATYGLTQDASKYDGDANGDDMVNAADYSLWRDSDGETVSGGIFLADSPGDRLEVGGTATFNAAADGRHEISIGVNDNGERNGWVELGTITALGSNVEIIEDAPSDLARIEAYNFDLTSSGKINILTDATVLVENDATLTSLYLDYQADFDGDGDVDSADRDRWLAAYGEVFDPTADSRQEGDANGDGLVNAADYSIWRDGLDAFDPDADIDGGITVEDGARFEAGGLVSLVAADSLLDPATRNELPEERFDITVNDAATARFGSLLLKGANVKVVEDAGAFKEARDGNQDGTVIAGIEAEQLLLVSYGPITAEAGADINVFGGDGLAADATFASTGSIVLADAAGKDVQIDGEATFIAGAGTQGEGTSIRVGVDASGVASTAVFNAAGIRFSTLLGEVRIAEDSGTMLLGQPTDPIDPCIPGGFLPTMNLAGSLELQSDGRITDADGAETSVFEDATFRVISGSLSGDDPAILLANETSDSLIVGGAATFIDASEAGIDVGADRPDGVTPFEAGRLRFSAGDDGAVRFIEVGTSILGTWSDASIDLLAGADPDRSMAGSLELKSSGVILDESDAIVLVTNDASFVATSDAGLLGGKIIRLADDTATASANRLEVGGTATFVDAGAGDAATGIDVGVAANGSPAEATFVAGKLRFSSPNAMVRIAEDDSTQLAGWSGNGISVLASAGDPMESVAGTLELWSAGFIADDDDATVQVTVDATLIANDDDTNGDAIRLADGPDNTNEFSVGGLATFIAGGDDAANTVTGNVALGVTSTGARADATFNVNSVRFFAEGAEARIAEDSSTVLATWTGASIAALPAAVTPSASEAQFIEIFSAGSITDAADAQVFARGADESVPASGATATFVATTDVMLADAGPGNRLAVDGLATFIAGDASRIDVGVVSTNTVGTDEGTPALAEFNAGLLRFSAPNGTVRIAEDSGTVLASWTAATIGVLGNVAPPESSDAATFELFANGAITDLDRARVNITGDATLVVSGTAAFEVTDTAAIRLADGDTPTNTFEVAGTTTLLVLPVAGATLGIDAGINSAGEAARSTFNTGSLRFAATGQDVRIAEDSDTVLAAWSDAMIASLGTDSPPSASTAEDLQLLTVGTLTDGAASVVTLTGDATLIALGNGEAIRLADGGEANAFTAAGTVTLISRSTDSATEAAGSILVGVTSATGAAADATFDAGKLRFYADGATVRVAEDSSTILTNWEADTLPALLPGSLPTESLAQTLELSSAGSITDMQLASDDTLDVVVRVTGLAGATDPMANATFVAAEDIVLADGAIGNELAVDGMATFVAGVDRAIDVGVVSTGGTADDVSPADAAFNARTLRFSTLGGKVRVAEDSSTVLTNWEADTISALIGSTPVESTAQTLELLSAGSITDAKNKTDDTSEVAVRITAPPAEEANATFIAATSITLADADSSTNQLLIDDLATFIAGDSESIDVGVDSDGNAALAEFNAGSVRFSSPNGMVRIAEDSGTELAAWSGAEIDLIDDTAEPTSSSADSFELLSSGLITDAEEAVVLIGGNAQFVVAPNAGIADAAPAGPPVQAIVLANSEMATNRIEIGGFAQFVVEVPAASLPIGFRGPKGIDVGVLASGMPADASFTAGSLRFFAPGGLVRIAEDDGTQIGALTSEDSSETSRLQIDSRGAITDEFTGGPEDGGSELTVTVDQWAELNANDGQSNIVLGDGDVVFRMSGDPLVANEERQEPALFDEGRYLAMEAFHVSVQADSAVNIRTTDGTRPQQDDDVARGGVFDSTFAGTYYLTATGNISQVGGESGSASLSADKVSLASSAAIFMTGLVLRNENEPNLQIKADKATQLDVLGRRVGDAGAERDLPAGFDVSLVPSSLETSLSPVDVQADGDDGSRSTVAPREVPRDETDGEQAAPEFTGEFEDILVGENPSRLAEREPEVGFDPPLDPVPPNTPIDIGDDYSAVVVVKSSVIVGDVADATGTKAEEDTARGFVVDGESTKGNGSALPGNAYLVADGAIKFTSVGREGQEVSRAEVVSMSGGVFTAVAGTTLSIETEDPNQPGEEKRTTLLRSETGVVTSIGGPEIDTDVTPGVIDFDTDRGPRALLDLPTDTIDAATTGVVRADNGFEQRITLAVGSRGEENLLVEVEWADVATVREQSVNNPTPQEILRIDPTATGTTLLRESYDSDAVPGSTPFADLVQTVGSELEVKVADRAEGTEPDVEYNGIGDEVAGNLETEFRVATIRNVFDLEFVPSNPAQNTLPTTVRVYNDPYINLYEGAASEEGVRDLNSAAVALAPRIIAVQGGFFLPIESEPPQEIVTREVMTFASEPITSEQQTNNDIGRAVVASNAESLEYGRIDGQGEWIDDIPGEAWPQVQEEVEGNFLREVRDRIDNGAYSEGTYRIQIVTPRGEQVLEEWVKGDLGEEGDVLEDEGFWGESGDEGELRDKPAPAVQPEVLPEGELIQPLSETSAKRFDSTPESNQAANAAFAAMAAVGGWRRRLGGTGAFKLDEDGVAFTRVKRRQRNRPD